MFYSNQMGNFKNFLLHTDRFMDIGNIPYVFLEDTNDIVSIGMEPYENSDLTVNTSNESLQLAFVQNQISFFIFNLILMVNMGVGFRFTVRPFGEVQSAYHFTLRHNNTILLKDFGVSVPLPLPYKLMGHNLYFLVDSHEYSPTFFLQTFQTPLWMYFLCSSVVIYGCLWITSKLIKQNRIVLFDFISLVLGNSITTSNPTISYYILMLSFLILLIIFYAAFGAFLDVLLAIKKFDTPFSSVNDLLSRPDFSVCGIVFSTAWLKLLHLTYQVDGKVSLNSEFCPKIDPISNNWESDYTFECNWNKMAFIFSEIKSNYEQFIIKNCDLAKFPGIFFNDQISFVTSLEFSFRELIGQKIILSQTSGNIDYLINTKYFKNFTSHPIGHDLVEIEFQHCKLIILLFAIGSVASFLILALEILWMKRTNRRIRVLL